MPVNVGICAGLNFTLKKKNVTIKEIDIITLASLYIFTIFKVMKKKLIELPLDTFEKVKKKAEDTGLKVNSWIRMILTKEVNK